MQKPDGIIITKTFNAALTKVWQAWTDPKKVKKWWGPKGFSAPSIKIDLQVGGKYIFCMHGPKGSEWDKDMYSAGKYLEIIPMEKLVITDYFSDQDGNKVAPTQEGMDANMPDEMKVEVTFKKINDKQTTLTIFYPRPKSDAAFEAMKKSGMNDGWLSSLDKLAKSI